MTNLLSQKAVLASLTISGWGARAYDKKVSTETNRRHHASDDAGRFNKLLIAKDAIAEINRIGGAARSAQYRLTQPWYDDGARVLPTALYDEFSKTLRAFKSEYETAVVVFRKIYPQTIIDAKGRLNAMFNEEDYPDPSEMTIYDWKKNPIGRFMFDIKIMPCPDIADFRVSLADEHAQDIKDDLERRMRDALEHAMDEPIHRVMEVVGNMVERLTAFKPAKPGSGKKTEGIFKDSLVDNIRDLVTLLPAFNLSNNKKLDAIITRMNRDLCSADAADLRTDAKLRDATKKAATAILSDAEALMG